MLPPKLSQLWYLLSYSVFHYVFLYDIFPFQSSPSQSEDTGDRAALCKNHIFRWTQGHHLVPGRAALRGCAAAISICRLRPAKVPSGCQSAGRGGCFCLWGQPGSLRTQLSNTGPESMNRSIIPPGGLINQHLPTLVC